LKELTKIAWILIVVISTGVKGYGQYFTLPDTNFRNYLYASSPQLLNGNKQLIIANAKTFSGKIDCNGMDIRDISGLQYFQSIPLLNCSNNPIIHLPHLDSLMALSQMYAEGCSLEKLPPVNHLTSLQVLSVKNNALTALPSLTGLTKLQYFDCSLNKLTGLPDLSSLVSLQKLYCWDNEITQLPELKTLVNLQVLDCPGNKLTALPSLSSNTALQTIRCGKNSITDLPSLNLLTNLKELSAEHNQLIQLPDLSNNDQLQIVNVSYNKLFKFPDLSNYTDLTEVAINNNQLGFSQLIPLTGHPSFSAVFEISPQDTILNYPLIRIDKNAPGTIAAGVDEGVTSNTYEWYKNGNFLTTTTASYITLDPPLAEDSGFYLCKETNTLPELTGITLIVRSAKVVIGPCITSSYFNYTILSNTCSEGAEVKINESANSSYKPFTYSYRSVNSHSEYSANSPVIQNVLPGIYDLRISDRNDCSILIQKFIHVPVAADCDNIITPNGDGIDDTYYVDNTGTMKIVNKEGRVIKELSIPGAWDGTDYSGKEVPIGLYILLINGKNKIGVVVIN